MDRVLSISQDPPQLKLAIGDYVQDAQGRVGVVSEQLRFGDAKMDKLFKILEDTFPKTWILWEGEVIPEAMRDTSTLRKLSLLEVMAREAARKD